MRLSHLRMLLRRRVEDLLSARLEMHLGALATLEPGSRDEGRGHLPIRVGGVGDTTGAGYVHTPGKCSPLPHESIGICYTYI